MESSVIDIVILIVVSVNLIFSIYVAVDNKNNGRY